MNRDQVYSTHQEKVRPSEVTNVNGSKFIGATFLYLTLALVVTFAVSGALGAILRAALKDESLGSLETFGTIFLIALIAYIPVMIWVHIAACRQGKTVGPAFFAYSIVMGALLSPIFILDIWTIIISLGSTCLAFAIMALIAWTTKKNLSGLAIFGFSLLIGAFVLSLFNLIISLFTGFVLLQWLVSFLFFFAILILTIVDLNHVKRIAQSGVATKNLAIWCALNLYVDFIYIFIRILAIVASIRNK